jgi:hypothetical protein
MVILNKLLIRVTAVRAYIISPGGLRSMIRSGAVTMLKNTLSLVRSTSLNISLEDISSSFGCLTKGVEKDWTKTIALNFRVWTSTIGPELLAMYFKSWRRKNLKRGKWAKIIDPLGIIHRVSEVERIHDGLILLDLQIVVVEKAHSRPFSAPHLAFVLGGNVSTMDLVPSIH